MARVNCLEGDNFLLREVYRTSPEGVIKKKISLMRDVIFKTKKGLDCNWLTILTDLSHSYWITRKEKSHATSLQKVKPKKKYFSRKARTLQFRNIQDLENTSASRATFSKKIAECYQFSRKQLWKIFLHHTTEFFFEEITQERRLTRVLKKHMGNLREAVSNHVLSCFLHENEGIPYVFKQEVKEKVGDFIHTFLQKPLFQLQKLLQELQPGNFLPKIKMDGSSSLDRRASHLACGERLFGVLDLNFKGSELCQLFPNVANTLSYKCALKGYAFPPAALLLLRIVLSESHFPMVFPVLTSAVRKRADAPERESDGTFFHHVIKKPPFPEEEELAFKIIGRSSKKAQESLADLCLQRLVASCTSQKEDRLHQAQLFLFFQKVLQKFFATSEEERSRRFSSSFRDFITLLTNKELPDLQLQKLAAIEPWILALFSFTQHCWPSKDIHMFMKQAKKRLREIFPDIEKRKQQIQSSFKVKGDTMQLFQNFWLHVDFMKIAVEKGKCALEDKMKIFGSEYLGEFFQLMKKQRVLTAKKNIIEGVKNGLLREIHILWWVYVLCEEYAQQSRSLVEKSLPDRKTPLSESPRESILKPLQRALPKKAPPRRKPEVARGPLVLPPDRRRARKELEKRGYHIEEERGKGSHALVVKNATGPDNSIRRVVTTLPRNLKKRGTRKGIENLCRNYEKRDRE